MAGIRSEFVTTKKEPVQRERFRSSRAAIRVIVKPLKIRSLISRASSFWERGAVAASEITSAAEWAACDDTDPMFYTLRFGTERQALSFKCAAARRILFHPKVRYPLSLDERQRGLDAITIVERFLKGEATREECQEARSRFYESVGGNLRRSRRTPLQCIRYLFPDAQYRTPPDGGLISLWWGMISVALAARRALPARFRAEERRHQAEILRTTFGNPFT